MSCGKHHEVACQEVLADVYIYLDAECDREAKQRIKQHLEECGECLREYGIEQEVKALVARCCSSEGSPEGLRDRLRAKLDAVTRTSP
ncbi:MAG: mycothiol system anti-sigma-R factor [Acidimicrobiales bacterium]|nr:MAG: mycothiol system anti-sigma-R factor [Acidimicrobiales bacterium]